MKTPLGTEVDLGTSHIVLDVLPAVREGGTAAPLFSAHIYCGHGRSSQLLLSSFYSFVYCVILVFLLLHTCVFYCICCFCVGLISK